MSDEPATVSRTSTATWIGLFLSLFGMLLVPQVVKYAWPDPTFTSAVVKELGMWITALVLLVIVSAISWWTLWVSSCPASSPKSGLSLPLFARVSSHQASFRHDVSCHRFFYRRFLRRAG
jgi:hypothetical protein